MDQKDTKAYFIEVYEEYNDAIFRFCLVKVSDRDRALDLTQETFARLWQSLRAGKEMENVRAYLYTIARNLVIDWYRKKKEMSLDTLLEDGFRPAADDHTDVVDEVDFKQAVEVIESLDEIYRDVLLMRYVEGLKPQDIAEVVGETPNVVSVRIHRGLKQLQDLLENNHGQEE